jgi:hypothetical protein
MNPLSMRAARAAAALALALPAAHAEEGMWTFDHLPLEHLRSVYDFAPDDAWIAHVMHASLRLTVGCSGSFISPTGLVLTNHHCVEDCVQQLSKAGHDLMRDGFLARTQPEERRCPAFAVERLDSIGDVTDRIAQATRGAAGASFAERRRAEISRIESECSKGSAGTTCEVVDLYHGGVEKLYRFRRFDDVRLVFAPEYDIAQFGGDPDNFEFPRYDLDMGIVRVYDDGHAVQPADWLRLRAAPAAPGELTITSGNPGRTERQLTVAQLETLRDIESPWRITRLAEQRGLLLRFSQESAENARIAKGELDEIENGFKALWGEQSTLVDPDVFARKRAEEAALRTFGARRADLKDDVGAWDEVAAAQRARRDLWLRWRFTEKSDGMWSKYFGIARNLVRAAAERPKPDAARLPEFSAAQIDATQEETLSEAPVEPALERLTLGWSLSKLREWLGVDDPLVAAVLGRESPDEAAARWVAQTRLGDPAERARLWRGGQAAIDASADPFIVAARTMDPESRAVNKRYEEQVEAVERRAAERIARVRFAQSGTSTYPDATFTPRLSFGIVEGWNEHGREIAPQTVVAGLHERARPFDPFRLPARWADARDALDPAEPMDFTTTNDIVGGNSGSPVLDRRGNLMGLAFDGNIDSLGGSFWWDESRNRTVAVEAGFIVDALRKIYRADALLSELEVVKR